MEEAQALTIELHYHLDKEGFHEMDAQIHNRCEAHILDAINHLADIFDENISLDVSALDKGGLIEKLKITLRNATTKSVFLIMVGALVKHFISPSTSLDDSQKLLNRAEIIQKIKEGHFTDSEIEYVISGDANFVSKKSKYYKELDKEPHVVCLSCSTYGKNCPNEAVVNNSIDKKDFHKQVIKNTTKTDTQNYIGTTVLVIAPVLSKGSQAKWKGVFNNEEIHFKIDDKEFLQQVYNKEVGFTIGTSLKCDVRVISNIVYDICGDISTEKKEIIISNVQSWFDGEIFCHQTKRYKRKKIEDSQLPLFKEEDF